MPDQERGWLAIEDIGATPKGVPVLLYDENEETFRVGAWDEYFEVFDMFGCNPDHCEPTHWRWLEKPDG